MASSARTSFLSGLQALREASDSSLVLSADATGQFIRRGLVVAAYNLLETFIADRWTELTTHINGGHAQFDDLPEKLQKTALENTLKVGQSRLRYSAKALSDLRSFSLQLGRSLSSVDGALQLSPFTWLWVGSNMHPSDLAKSLRSLHADKPWAEMISLAETLKFKTTDATGGKIDLEDDLTDLMRERHNSAHNAAHSVTAITLRSIPDRLLRIATPFDILFSVGAHEIRHGNQEFLGNPSWLAANKVTIRFVKEREKDYAEQLANAARPAHVNRDGDRLFADACRRAAAKERQVVAKADRFGSIVDWSVPVVS